MNWKALAIAAMIGQTVTLGTVIIVHGRAQIIIKRARKAVDVMSNCTDSCVDILDDDALDFDEKLDRMSEEFQFVQMAIKETYERGIS
jgi:hypothetical protein